MKKLLHSDLEKITQAYRSNDPLYKLGIRFASVLWLLGILIWILASNLGK
jgi:hypothetical protein